MEIAAKTIGEIAWPLAAVGMLLILLRNIDVIGRAFRKAPIIRRLKLSGFEIELSKESTDELKEETEKAFETLISRTDHELASFSRTIGLDEILSRFSIDFWSKISAENRLKFEAAKPRITLYIHDPIFVDQLYQISAYHNPKNGRPFLLDGKGPGRRFSIRYGIIGLATRSKSVEIIGDAFKGKSEERSTLIREWSMTEAQAESAKNKPSCLALSVFNPTSKAHVGLIYVDAEIDHFFCGRDDYGKFLHDIYNLNSFLYLVTALTDMHKLARQIDVRFDLTKIRAK